MCDTTHVVYLSSAGIGGTVTSRLVGITFSDTPQYGLNWYSLVCVKTIICKSVQYIIYSCGNLQEAERE